MKVVEQPAPRPVSVPDGGARDDAVEGLRALAALMVLYVHVTTPGPVPVLDPAYAPTAIFWRFETAMPGVMLFFIISGYVIGLTNSAPFSRPAIASYLRRRAVRLLPIYFAAALIGWAVLPGPSLRDLGGNLLLLQNAAPDNPFGIRLLSGNANLWSLHYEAIYYLGFLLVWWLRPPLAVVIAALVLVGGLGAFVSGFSLWLAWLACGAVFWIAGLGIAWGAPVNERSEHAPWPSALLLMLATWKLQVLHAILARLGHPIAWLPGITFDYLDALPCLAWLFLLTTRRQPAWRQWLEAAVWIIPAGYLAWRFRSGIASVDANLVVPLSCVLLAAIVRRWKPSLQPLRQLAPLGAISYGIYAFGAPAQHFVRSLWPELSGTWWTYAARAVLVVGLALLAAWLFDHWLQPRLRRAFASAGTRRAIPNPVPPAT